MRRRADVRDHVRGSTIGGVRILAGLLWLANIHWKVPPHFGKDTGGGLYKYSAGVLRHDTFGPYRWATEHIVLPHFALFGWVLLLMEISLAGLLLIGYRTRLVALVGAAAAVPIMLSVLYYDRGDEWSWSYLLMIGLHLLLWAESAGDHLGVDGLLAGSPGRARRGLVAFGSVGAVVGLLGLFVARSIDFAGRQAALLGSDAGFVSDGRIVRRWELKFLWFNPLWALLTLACAILLAMGARKVVAAYVGAAGFAVLAVVLFAMESFNYVRDDGSIQKVATGSNVAFFAGLALAGVLLARRGASAPSVPAPGPADA